MSNVTIRDIRTIFTEPDGIRLVIVKIETSEPGLYGIGCATFTQRPTAVKSALDDYLRPLLLGRDVADIEDIWQTSYISSYWRNGPVLNNAMSGVDQALWDIKGKIAGMPVHDLFGAASGLPSDDCYPGAAGIDVRSAESRNTFDFLRDGYGRRILLRLVFSSNSHAGRIAQRRDGITAVPGTVITAGIFPDGRPWKGICSTRWDGHPGIVYNPVVPHGVSEIRQRDPWGPVAEQLCRQDGARR